MKSAVRYIQWSIFIRYNWSLPNIYHCIPINCPQKRIHVKFRDHSGQNIARLKLEVESYLNNNVEINQDVSSNTNNICNNLFVKYSNCCPIKEKEIYFARLRKSSISDPIMLSLNRKHELFRQYHNVSVTFDHYNALKNNFTTTLRLTKNNYFQRKFTEWSNSSRDTWTTLNSLIRRKNTSEDVILQWLLDQWPLSHCRSI